MRTRRTGRVGRAAMAPPLVAAMVVALVLVGPGGAALAADVERPAGWTEASHSNDVEPNYQEVFPDDEVNEIAITIAPEDWAAMQANMVELAGEPGTRGMPGDRGGVGGEALGDAREAARGMPSNARGFDPAVGGFPGGFPGGAPPDGAPPAGGAPGAAGAGGAPGGAGAMGARGLDMISENPMWVPATITYEGQTWTHVGVRYKGNSTLLSAWNAGSLKLPFKFDFDEFEDDYPEIKNQRFFGFKQLSLSNAIADDSFMHDAIAYDLLEAAGLVAAQSAYYHVTLDYGEGPVDLGLYVVMEVIDDTVIPTYFGGDDGNIYEGDGVAASLAEGTFDSIEASFEKENNEDEADWSDVEALYQALHSDLRTSDPAAWRDELEAVFDVGGFLRWLALGGMLQNWDAYGQMAHNYYLYDDPASGQLTWIAWDHDHVLEGGRGGGPGGRGGAIAGSPGGGTSVDRSSVSASWPLIRYLLDDPTYHAAYVEHVADLAANVFDVSWIEARYDHYQALIEAYAAAEVGEETFQAAVEALRQNTEASAASVAAYLEAEGR